MANLLHIYFYALPIVLGAALIEGLWLSRTDAKGYDWKAWATSLADLVGRQLIAVRREQGVYVDVREETRV